MQWVLAVLVSVFCKSSKGSMAAGVRSVMNLECLGLAG